MAYRGRPHDDSLRFFPFHTDLTRDIKLTRVKRKHGILGVYVYICILEMIYGSKNGYFIPFDDDVADDILFYELGGDELDNDVPGLDKVKEVITDLIRARLFDAEMFKTQGVLTSKRIQLECEYATYITKRRHANFKPEYMLIGENELTREDTVIPPESSRTLRNPPEENRLTREENELTREDYVIPRVFAPQTRKTRLDETRLDEKERLKESTAKQPGSAGPAAAATPTQRDYTPEAVVLLKMVGGETTSSNVQGACAWIERLGLDAVQQAAENAMSRGKGWGYVVGTLKNLEAQQGQAPKAGRASSVPPPAIPPADDLPGYDDVGWGGSPLSPDSVPWGIHDD